MSNNNENKDKKNLETTSDFKFSNSLNKVKVGLKMFWEADKVLFDEGKKLFTNHDNSAADKLKDFPSNLAFKLGLVTTGVKWHSRFNFKTRHAEQAQSKVLLDIIKENRETQFGKDHDFDNIKSIKDFQNKVPVQTYDTLKPYIDKHLYGGRDALVKGKPISYATTSGTTGEPKYIPITEKASELSHKAVARLWAYQLYKDRPAGYDGKILTIVSPAEEGKAPDGTPFGSTSGQFAKGMNKVVQKKYAIPYDIFTIDHYDSRYYCILRMAIEENVTFLSTANPSTLNLLAKKSDEWKETLIEDIRSGTLKRDLTISYDLRKALELKLRPNPQLADKLEKLWKSDKELKLRPSHFWPELSIIGCWTGGNSQTFLKELNHSYGDVLIRDLGYLASEIRGSIPLASDSNAGVLTLHQNFFEFVHVDDIDSETPQFLTCNQVEVGQRYYVFITTKAGLYRYNINDIIEVKTFYNSAPAITFVQKGKGVTSITGEKLYEEQLMEAINRASAKDNIEVVFFMALARVDQSRYELYCEFKEANLSAELKKRFITHVENELQTINMEYQAKRKSLRLSPIELLVLDSGAFEAFKRMRIAEGVREAQFKTEPLTQDPKKVESFTVQEVVRV